MILQSSRATLNLLFSRFTSVSLAIKDDTGPNAEED